MKEEYCLINTSCQVPNECGIKIAKVGTGRFYILVTDGANTDKCNLNPKSKFE